jgi:Concanavalin A-like lectin/glucanases superfamily
MDVSGRTPGLGRATWIASPHWGVGRAGLCTVHDGGNTLGLALEGTNSATNLLKRQYPITLEAVVEPFGNQSLHRTIFTNDDWDGSTYRGRVLQFTTDNRFQINLGDGTGNGAADRRTFHIGSALTLSKVYHVIATIRGATTGSFWINGLSTSYTTSGTGGTTISYAGTSRKDRRARRVLDQWRGLPGPGLLRHDVRSGVHSRRGDRAGPRPVPHAPPPQPRALQRVHTAARLVRHPAHRLDHGDMSQCS